MTPIEATGKVASSAIIVLLVSAASAQVDIPCLHHNEREHLQGIMRDALDDSMKQQTMHLFEGWLKDPTGQPARATKGMSLLLKSYRNARTAVDEWHPPQCEEGKTP
jgi:hypothetical protein